jgi:hypothetical protein
MEKNQIFLLTPISQLGKEIKVRIILKLRTPYIQDMNKKIIMTRRYHVQDALTEV